MLVYGQPEDTATIHLGYGREVVGPIGRGRGFNAFACRKADSPWFLTGVNLAKTGGPTCSRAPKSTTTSSRATSPRRTKPRIGTLIRERSLIISETPRFRAAHVPPRWIAK